MDHFNSQMLDIMDDIAPFKLKKVNSKQKSPWKLNSTVKLLKRECRKTERQWRKTKLPVHYIIYKEKLKNFNFETGKARQLFFSNIINQNLNNARVLFFDSRKIDNSPSKITT